MRRFISVTAVFVTATLAMLTAPLWLPASVVFDLVARKRLATARALLFLTFFTVCECLGVLTAAALWLAKPLISGRWLALHYALQRRWASALWRALCGIYNMTLELEGDFEGRGQGGTIAFFRHASTADTVLPMAAWSVPQAIRPRYVLKRELLWDPCLDIVGQRLPNTFVDRDSNDSAAQVDAVGALAKGMGPGDGVIIFPEGTRFTRKRRSRVIARAKNRGDTATEKLALDLDHTLPPRKGGPLALLSAAPKADVLVVAHTGFEGVRTMGDLFGGVLIDKRVVCQARRFEASAVPREPDAAWAWLVAQWRVVDNWIESHHHRPRWSCAPTPTVDLAVIAGPSHAERSARAGVH